MDKIKKVYYTVNVKNRQRKVNKDFKENGLSDELLEEQISINQLKHEHDIVLDEDKIHENFIQ